MPDIYHASSRSAVMSAAMIAAMSADALDAQYNNRLRVPDFLTRHVAPWQARS